MAEIKRRKDGDSRLNTLGYGVGTGVLGYHTIRSGVPRALGVRLESHSTSHETAKKILSKGFLEPSAGGTGAVKMFETLDGADNEGVKHTLGKVHITGVNANSPVKTPGAINALIRKAQQTMYRSTPYVDHIAFKKNPGLHFAGELAKTAVNPFRGRSLYVGGTDDYFNKNFTADPYDAFAQTSTEKVRVYGNRFAATGAAIEREGLGKLMGANKVRVAAGLGILGLGGAGTVLLGKKAVESFQSDGSVKRHIRRSKNGKLTIVRSFKRSPLGGRASRSAK